MITFHVIPFTYNECVYRNKQSRCYLKINRAIEFEIRCQSEFECNFSTILMFMPYFWRKSIKAWLLDNSGNNVFVHEKMDVFFYFSSSVPPLMFTMNYQYKPNLWMTGMNTNQYIFIRVKAEQWKGGLFMPRYIPLPHTSLH